jgi:hypothetical protein
VLLLTFGLSGSALAGGQNFGRYWYSGWLGPVSTMVVSDFETVIGRLGLTANRILGGFVPGDVVTICDGATCADIVYFSQNGVTGFGIQRPSYPDDHSGYKNHVGAQGAAPAYCVNKGPNTDGDICMYQNWVIIVYTGCAVGATCFDSTLKPGTVEIVVPPQDPLYDPSMGDFNLGTGDGTWGLDSWAGFYPNDGLTGGGNGGGGGPGCLHAKRRVLKAGALQFEDVIIC